MKQIQYKWKLPILIDDEYNVLCGNSLKDSLPDDIIVVIAKKDELLERTCNHIELAVVEEGSEKRYHMIYQDLTKFFVKEKYANSQMQLFQFKEKGFITEENYIKPRAYNFTKHTKKVDKIEKTDYDIDLEIMKELLE